MTVEELHWLWNMSAPACAHEFGSGSIRPLRLLKRRLAFVKKGMGLVGSLRPFIGAPVGSRLHRGLMERPEMVGAVLWPYICASWTPDVCLRKIASHYEVMEKIGSGLDSLLVGGPPLLRLDEMYPDLRVVLDQPRWFLREGLLAINLFVADSRVYSMAFSFAMEQGDVVAYVGAIQGINAEGMIDQYRDLTKALHGMRPRDFLVESFRCFCRCLGISSIYAVDDRQRHHRSAYFGSVKANTIFLNYNDIWNERGGVKESDDFYKLSVTMPAKSLDEVPSKKRAMYRRRYDLLQVVGRQIQDRLTINA